MVTEMWETELTEDHRALLKMVRERTPDFERAALDSLNLAQLGVVYANLLLDEVVRIPAGTPGKPCRQCGRILFWIPNRWNVKSPITDQRYLEPLSIHYQGFAPTATEAGEGTPHHGDCPHSIYRTTSRRETADAS